MIIRSPGALVIVVALTDIAEPPPPITASQRQAPLTSLNRRLARFRVGEWLTVSEKNLSQIECEQGRLSAEQVQREMLDTLYMMQGLLRDLRAATYVIANREIERDE